MTDKTFEETAEQVKTALLEAMIESVRHGKATTSDAQFFAQNVLAVGNFQDTEDMLTKLNTLAMVHKEAQGVYLQYAADYYSQKEAALYEQMVGYIHQGKLDDAQAAYIGGMIHV